MSALCVFYKLEVLTKDGAPDESTAAKIYEWGSENIGDWFSVMELDEHIISTDGESDYGSDVDFNVESEPFGWVEGLCRKFSDSLIKITCNVDRSEYMLDDAYMYAKAVCDNGEARISESIFYSEVYGMCFATDSCYGHLLGKDCQDVVVRLKSKSTGEEETFCIELWPQEDDGCRLYDKVESREFKMAIDMGCVELVTENGAPTTSLDDVDFAKSLEGSDWDEYEFVAIEGLD